MIYNLLLPIQKKQKQNRLMSFYAENANNEQFECHVQEPIGREILIKDCNDNVLQLINQLRINYEKGKLSLLRKKRNRRLSPL
jgi:uncharacterized protein (DUF2461 family)